ncbi:hypothetical protein OJF2_25730 [Aquisphaera giovannonii]|uniref:YHS domain protein n=1 Tax=Aquisphaera giovannonii TaxID=406548 RepID=A0A5B9W231_9BACT|nr:hypothetical protein [Aquisphaera giovannonii]QEH34040.1 hypothetical protein OJF2_25730 [Aquisphaera giovannonii]
MKTRDGILGLAVALALGGCAGDEAADKNPPAASPVAPAKPVDSKPAAKPDVTPAKPADEKKPADAKPASAPEATPSKPAGDAGKGDLPPLEPPKSSAADSAHPALSDKEIANIKLLPEADQAAALKQAVCPVSDENLGSMDKPVKLTLEGRTVFLCCDGCEKKAKKDPAAIFAKLDQKK